MTPPHFCIFISPLRRIWPFIWTNLNSLHPRIICTKFKWIRSAGSWEVGCSLSFEQIVLWSFRKRGLELRVSLTKGRTKYNLYGLMQNFVQIKEMMVVVWYNFLLTLNEEFVLRGSDIWMQRIENTFCAIIVLNTHRIKWKWFQSMQVDSENCTIPFLFELLGDILINEWNIALNCKNNFHFRIVYLHFKRLTGSLIAEIEHITHFSHLLLCWLVCINSMICYAVRDKNITPPPNLRNSIYLVISIKTTKMLLYDIKTYVKALGVKKYWKF
jgi:membrane protein CcdC involved in cytochrome C biogenesis